MNTFLNKFQRIALCGALVAMPLTFLGGKAAQAQDVYISGRTPLNVNVHYHTGRKNTHAKNSALFKARTSAEGCGGQLTIAMRNTRDKRFAIVSIPEGVHGRWYTFRNNNGGKVIPKSYFYLTVHQSGAFCGPQNDHYTYPFSGTLRYNLPYTSRTP